LQNEASPLAVSTIVEKATRKFRYTLYLGFDLEDVVYDDKRKLEQVRKRMVTMIGDYPVQVIAVRARHRSPLLMEATGI
jgi:hypothetical protein